MSDYPPLAAVDLGSNSFHLLVAREVEGNMQVLHREKQKICLADGLDKNRLLSPEAIDRAVDVLRQFAETLQDFHADKVKVAATYALRTAVNIKTFLAQAAAVFPYPIEVISGQEEARLIYQGVAHYLHHDNNRLVIDIGGGSTELIIGNGFKPLRLSSRNMGSASYTRRFFGDGQISAKAFKAATIRAEQELEVIHSGFMQAGWQVCVGTSGTIKCLTNIAAQHFGSDQLTHEHLTRLRDEMIATGHIEALAIPGLSEDRIPSICGGVAIMLATFELLGIRSLSYCDFSLREGLLHEMQDKLHAQDIRVSTVDSFCRRFNIDLSHAELIQSSLRFFYQRLERVWGLGNHEYLITLLWSAQLHEIGLSINSSGIHKHSAYIVENSLLPGFTQQQQQLLASLIRFHRKKIRTEEIPEFNTLSRQTFYYLLVIMRLTVLLNQKRQPDYLPNFDLKATSDTLKLQLPAQWLAQQPLLYADLKSEQRYLRKIGIKLKF